MITEKKYVRYQAQLQKNLLYLAAIADAQPQAPAMRPQVSSVLVCGFGLHNISANTDVFLVHLDHLACLLVLSSIIL